MLRRLGIENRVELSAFASLALLVAISPLGREATHPVVLGLTRTFLMAIIIATIIQTTGTAQRICGFFLGAAAAIVTAMLASVLFQAGSHFEGTYVFYQNVLFLAAFVSLALWFGVAWGGRWIGFS